MPRNKALLKNKTSTRPLTNKQKAFVKHLLENPKASATQAALVAYGKPDKDINSDTARSIASENLAKPYIMAALNDAVEEAEATILSVMRTSTSLRENPQHARVAETAANSVLDRVHGKATTNVQVTQAVVTINMDLSTTVS